MALRFLFVAVGVICLLVACQSGREPGWPLPEV